MSAVLQLPADLIPEAVPRAQLAVVHGWRKGWEIPPALLVSEWADEYRYLPENQSAEGGQWRTKRNPPLRKIMDSLSVTSPVQKVVLCKGTQGGGTEAGNNAVGYWIHHAPGPIMVVTGTGKLAKRWSRKRFDQMVAHCDALSRVVASPRSQDGSNTLDYKAFVGGDLVIASAESGADMASDPIRYLFGDEVDSWPLDVDGEGSPVVVAERRTTTWGRRRKILLVSSPKKILANSLIWAEYLAGDQEQCYVPCPKCGHMQVLIFENVLHTGEYLCESCAHGIPHGHKTDMLEAHDWVAKYPDRDPLYQSFHLPSLYNPDGLGYNWKYIYDQRVAAGDDPAKIKAFVTTLLAEPYDPADKVNAEDLKGCREDWHMREIPRGVLLITAAVDVQKNRFAIKIVGWGRGPQGWLLDVVELPASPVDPAAWDELEEYLDQPLTNSFGIDMPIEMTAVDSGNWTTEVYAAVHPRQHKGWIAVKGSKEMAAPLIGKPSLKDVTVGGRVMRSGIRLYNVGVNGGKDAVLDRLSMVPQQDREDRWFHIPADIPDWWFDQVTAEQRDPETGRWEKVKKGRANEATDTLVYNYAAACHPKIGLLKIREHDWKRREEMYQPLVGDLFAQPTGGAGQASPVTAAVAPSQTPKPATPAPSVSQETGAPIIHMPDDPFLR